jgi:release factor glutamine methyltransferase
VASVASLLRASGLPPLEARVLLCQALAVERSWLAAHDTDELPATAATTAEALFSRRRAGEPIAYITGEWEFYGRTFKVSPDVLIPRPETELLVEIALERLAERGSLLDLGTGSGAIAVSVALERPDARVCALDSSEEALTVARSNALRLGAAVEWLSSDWFAALSGRRFDTVVSNPPYIASTDAHLSKGDLRFEPRRALDAGHRGLEAIEHIALHARDHLVPGGWLAFEHGYDQGEACVGLLSQLGYREVQDCTDLAGHRRVAVARFDP